MHAYMSRAAKPTLITIALSAAAVLGYVAYRFTLDRAPAVKDVPTIAASGAESDEGAPPALLDELPEFSMTNLAGEQQSIRSWPGQALVVNFWATWCAPCLREIPMLKAFQEANPHVTVVGIAVDTFDDVEPFAADMQFNYPILIGRTEAMNATQSFNVDFFALPFTIFTDSEGRTLGVRTGELHQEHLDDFLAVLADLEAGRATLADARARIAGFM